MINREYNSPVRQTRVKNYLNTLRVSDFVKGGFEISSALAKVNKLITKLSRHVPASHRGDSHKIEFLRNATVGFSWSREPLSRVATHSLTFQMLYGELEAALQLDKEAKLALARDNALGKSIHYDERGLGIHYAGQGRYGNNLRYVRTRRKSNARRSIKPVDIAGWFNCGESDHFVKDCKKPMNAAKAAAKKLEYYGRKESMRHPVHLVLADLCQQIDSEPPSSDAVPDGESSDDVEIFQAVLAGNATAEDEQNHPVALLPEPSLEVDSDPNEIFVMTSAWNVETPPHFEGACIDSGAQKTVIGLLQVRAYCTLLNADLDDVLKGQKLLFTFGNKKHKGLGHITIRMPVSNGFFLSFTADVVDLDVPLLLGLDLLTQASLILYFAHDAMRSKTDG